MIELTLLSCIVTPYSGPLLQSFICIVFIFIERFGSTIDCNIVFLNSITERFLIRILPPCLRRKLSQRRGEISSRLLCCVVLLAFEVNLITIYVQLIIDCVVYNWCEVWPYQDNNKFYACHGSFFELASLLIR